MRFKVLVVDDNADNRELIKGWLELDDHVVLLAKDGNEAFQVALDSGPDLVLSDVMMPVDDGLTLCRKLKGDARTAATPVVLMSGARLKEEEQVEGIERGADDYLLRPFSPRLLRAKVQAVLRRYAAPADLHEVLSGSGLELDVQALVVTLKGARGCLHRKELDPLPLLPSAQPDRPDPPPPLQSPRPAPRPEGWFRRGRPA